LQDRDEQRLLHRFTSVTKATLKGTLIIGALQGFICGLAFMWAGIQAPVFWGSMMAILSIVPAFGTAIIWGPALILLILKGEFIGGGILVVLCGVIAGNLDNILRPKLVGKDTELHDLLILFGTLGGITMFGILGIIIGPIIAALFTTIWEIYGNAFSDYLPEVGPLFRSDTDKPVKTSPPALQPEQPESTPIPVAAQDKTKASAAQTSHDATDATD
ncbi:MAG: AI-2E family transporter, partial [Desulfobulbus sp.]|nr:AI-2E family transporter [Desulfobulbus sp.]